MLIRFSPNFVFFDGPQSPHNGWSFACVCSLPSSRLIAFKASSTRGTRRTSCFTTTQKAVSVTAEPNRHLRVVNRQLAIALMMFRGMVREPLDEEFHRNLADQIAEIEKQRLDSAGTDGVVVIQVKGDVSASIRKMLASLAICCCALTPSTKRGCAHASFPKCRAS